MIKARVRELDLSGTCLGRVFVISPLRQMFAVAKLALGTYANNACTYSNNAGNQTDCRVHVSFHPHGVGEVGEEVPSLVVVIMAFTKMNRKIVNFLKDKRMAIVLVGTVWNISHVVVASSATYFNLLGLEIPPPVEAALNIISILLAIVSLASAALAFMDWCRALPVDTEATDKVYSRLTSVETSTLAPSLSAWREPDRSLSEDSAKSITLMLEQLTI